MVGGEFDVHGYNAALFVRCNAFPRQVDEVCRGVLDSEVCFRFKFIFKYSDPINLFFLMIKIPDFRGDLSDVSARAATLVLDSE